MSCPTEHLIPGIKAGDRDQRSLWKVLEVLTTWDCWRTAPRAYCTSLKDKDQLRFGQVLPLVPLARGYLDCVGQSRTSTWLKGPAAVLQKARGDFAAGLSR